MALGVFTLSAVSLERLLFAFVSVGTLGWLAIIAIALYRSALGKRCWYCGAEKVRASATVSLGDGIARLSLLFPYRCNGCLRRFYRFR